LLVTQMLISTDHEIELRFSRCKQVAFSSCAHPHFKGCPD
jgi:hypothetical protein